MAGCSAATGHRPAPPGLREADEQQAEGQARGDSLRQAGAQPPRTEPLAATSTMAGRAASTPATASSPGRSPSATPTGTGNTAAPTAETGPTTLIWPRASPR